MSYIEMEIKVMIVIVVAALIVGIWEKLNKDK
jgi:hypothetical protein